MEEVERELEEEVDLVEESELEKESDSVAGNFFYDNGIMMDLDFCSDDNTYTNQQDQQSNPVEIHNSVNEQDNSQQDPSNYVSINGRLFNKKDVEDRSTTEDEAKLIYGCYLSCSYTYREFFSG